MSRKKTTAEYVSEVEEIHQGKYGYDKLMYDGANKPVIICCPAHGYVEVNSTAHRSGKGCKKCGDSYRGAKRVKPLSDFIAKALFVHGDNYDYSHTSFTKLTDKADVICKLHGMFQITPRDHKRGIGCPSCSGYGFQKTKPGTLYIVTNGFLTKVGITNRQLKHRLSKLNRDGKEFVERFSISLEDGTTIFNLEQNLLKYLRRSYKQASGKFDGCTETFENVNVDELVARLIPWTRKE